MNFLLAGFLVFFCGINLIGFVVSPLVGFFFLITNVIVSAIMVLLAKNPINSLFFLIATFFNTSIFLIVLNIDFLAIVFVIIYIGAISVFFLFMIMMLNIMPVSVGVRVNANFLKLVFFFMSMFLFVYSAIQVFRFGLEKNLFAAYNITDLKFNYNFFISSIYEVIGHFFYTYYSIPLVLISIFLLVIMIGVIILPVVFQPIHNRKYLLKSVFVKTVEKVA